MHVWKFTAIVWDVWGVGVGGGSMWWNRAASTATDGDDQTQKLEEVYLGVEVATDGLLGPRLVVKLRSSLLFRVPYHISHGLWNRKSQLEGAQISKECMIL